MGPKDIKHPLHFVISCPQPKITHLCFGEDCFFKGHSSGDSFCCWRRSEGQTALEKQSCFWQVLCKCVPWGIANAACRRASLSAAHQPLLKSCSASALSKCSTELYCNLKPLNWGAWNRPILQDPMVKKHITHLCPFFSGRFW